MPRRTFYRLTVYNAGSPFHEPQPVIAWRWTLRGLNGRIIGAATESYTRRAGCLLNFAVVCGITLDGLDKIKRKRCPGGLTFYASQQAYEVERRMWLVP